MKESPTGIINKVHPPLTLSTMECSPALSRTAVEIVPIKKPQRIAALDFTKGALVLIMVLYHWMNYFVMTDGSIYKYLRFLTPSFIFITGFLISHLYLSKSEISGRGVSGRLLLRGLKLLALVFCLNLALSAVQVKGLHSRVGDRSLGEMVFACLTGVPPVTFSVLVPIAYLLILSAGLLIISRHFRNVFHVACAVFLMCTLVLDQTGIRGGYLQIFSIGMLGISVGYIPIDQINRLAKHPWVLFAAYLAYLGAITVWDVVYPLQILGVGLSLGVIYWIGVEYSETSPIHRITVLLGRYSLFGYIVQIVILQILRTGLRPIGTDLGISASAFFAAAAFTILSVETLDRARSRMTGLNKVYTAVFC